MCRFSVDLLQDLELGVILDIYLTSYIYIKISHVAQVLFCADSNSTLKIMENYLLCKLWGTGKKSLPFTIISN